jgi:tRNA splicing endonuclease
MAEETTEPTWTLTVIKTKEQQTPQINAEEIKESLHNIAEKVYEYSKAWTIKPIDPTDLFIRNEQEYTTIQQYRKIQRLNSEMLTKKLLDNLILNENGIFESRNQDKKPTTTIQEPPKENQKKKGLFNRTKRV